MLPFYYNAFDKNASNYLQKELKKILSKTCTSQHQIIILCIGTDRATGDCLGPLVGNHLKQTIPNVPVYGTLQEPIHALNIKETIDSIYANFQNPYIIAIDASLGTKEHIGYATISATPLNPGKGVNKKLPAIGDLSITGIVNISGFPNSILLQSTRLYTVATLADCISQALSAYFSKDYLLTFL